MKQRDRENAERRGFEDALEFGARDPGKVADHIRIAYDRGFYRGERAAKRLIELANASVGAGAAVGRQFPSAGGYGGIARV